MRKMIAAATFGLVLGVAGATAGDEMTPEGRAYFGMSFGGERAAPRDLHYGLRLDHDSRHSLEGGLTPPPVMQFDFTPRGFSDARVNGLSVIKRQYRMGQDEGGEDVVEEEGFFEGMFNSIGRFFGGLFGGDEEEETAEGVPGEEEVTEGTFMGYNTIDWATLAVGAVGLGFVISEVTGGDEDANPQAGGGATAGGGGCSIENLPACEPTGGSPIGGVLGAVAGATPTGLPAPLVSMMRDGNSQEWRERLEWLDGGTGQMGDLEPRN
jgi:hypothetical protein